MAVASLRARLLLSALTSEALAALDPLYNRATPAAVYAGFDPTAPSLHLGNMVALMGLKHFQLAGFKPILLIGGATALIGDPSGRATERSLLDESVVEANIIGIKDSISSLFDFDGPNSAVLVNNMDFYRGMSAIGLVRDVGRHFRVQSMLARDSVKSRLTGDAAGGGISFTEFSYQLFQAHDFAVLARDHGCVAQLGGNDQWGNITAGVDLIRRTLDKEVFGATVPLLTTSTGEKFGKSAGNAVWMNPGLTTHYDVYQFLLRTTDEDVGKLLKMLTLLPLADIEDILVVHAQNPSARVAQKALAFATTELIRGKSAATSARDASQAMFGGSSDTLTVESLERLAQEGGVPKVYLPRADFLNASYVSIAVTAGIVKSKGECRRLITAGGAYLNGARVDNAELVMQPSHLVGNAMCILRAGKKNHAIVVVQ